VQSDIHCIESIHCNYYEWCDRGASRHDLHW